MIFVYAKWNKNKNCAHASLAKKLNVFFSEKEKKKLLVNKKGGKKMKMENASNFFFIKKLRMI